MIDEVSCQVDCDDAHEEDGHAVLDAAPPRVRTLLPNLRQRVRGAMVRQGRRRIAVTVGTPIAETLAQHLLGYVM